MDIVYSSSDSYAMCTGISLYSMYENNKDVEELNVYILSTDISEKNRSYLHNVARQFDRPLTIIDAKEDFIRESDRLHLSLMRGAYNTYSRVMLNTWFSSLDKIMVVDSDTLVCGSLKDAWDLDIDDYYIAAVPEIAMYGKYSHLEDPQLLESLDMYYNMGVCVLNLKKWRDDGVDEIIYSRIQTEVNSFKIADQSIINKYLAGSIARLHLRYNFYTPLHNVPYQTINKVFNKKVVFSESELKEASEYPSIIHYFGHSYERPWFKHSVALRQKQYLDIKERSPWSDAPLLEWRSNSSTLFEVYDYLCYLLLRLKQYKTCLVFRYQIGQMLKDKLKRTRN